MFSIPAFGHGDPSSHEPDKYVERVDSIPTTWRMSSVDGIENRPEVAFDYNDSNWQTAFAGHEFKLDPALLRPAKNVIAVVATPLTSGRLMNLITSDEYKPYKRAILKAYGRKIEPATTGKRGRPTGSRRVPPKGLKYAVVHKTRRKGRVVKIDLRVVFGSKVEVEAAIETSAVSKMINTAFVERHNGTDRNARKTRKTYCFSKDWDVHEAVTYFAMYSYNFCWPVRTLAVQDADGGWLRRTPAMVAGMTDHVWSLKEWLNLPTVQS